MKRRDLLKGAIYSSPLTLKVGDVFAQDDTLVVGEDVLSTYDPVSHDITEFAIKIERITSTIYITPRNMDKPFLAVVALHRYLQGLMDDVHGDGDITILDRNPSVRYMDTYVGFENGWTVANESVPFLYGAITQGNNYQCSAQLIGRMDPRLVKDLHIFDEHGNKFYQYKGVFNIPTRNPHMRLTMKYSAYRNLISDDNGVRHNEWVRSVYNTEFTFGTVYVPIDAVG